MSQPNPKLRTQPKSQSSSPLHPRRPTSSKQQFPPLPPTFVAKKLQILDAISVPVDSYTDKSPKGSIDEPIVELIRRINEIDGIVTTSSCSGRVAVFVEGPRKPENRKRGEGRGRNGGVDTKIDEDVNEDGDRNEDPRKLEQEAGDEDEDASEDDGDKSQDYQNNLEAESDAQVKATTGSPAGKGGGRWLYVSHHPVPIPSNPPKDFFTNLCCLRHPAPDSDPYSSTSTSTSPRLIKLSFSPLILHILCASLAHAKPLLSAAVNAGFRESGVHSLRALDEPDAGVMVGIRTAGLAFETVVGVVGGEERCERIVDEGFLRMVFGVVNERFVWNERRRERLWGEIRKGFGGGVGLDRSGGVEWEDAEVRRQRKREEGLKRKKVVEEERKRLDGSTEWVQWKEERESSESGVGVDGLGGLSIGQSEADDGRGEAGDDDGDDGVDGSFTDRK